MTDDIKRLALACKEAAQPLSQLSAQAKADLLQAMAAALDVPILANMTEFGKSELFSVDALRDAGVRMVIWPVSLLRIAMGAAGRALDTLNDEGHLTSKLGEMQHRADLYELIDYESYNHFDSGVFNFTLDNTGR